jgi:hypothetical protein
VDFAHLFGSLSSRRPRKIDNSEIARAFVRISTSMTKNRKKIFAKLLKIKE